MHEYSYLSSENSDLGKGEIWLSNPVFSVETNNEGREMYLLNRLKHKNWFRFLAVILIFTFSFSSIGLPSSHALAAEIAAAPKMVDKAAPISDTVNKPKSLGNVLIAPPSDLPVKPGKTRTELPSRRSANSKQFLEPDGTFTLEVYPESIFYKNNKHEWVPVDSNLEATAGEFNAKNKANRFNILFGNGSKVRFQDKDLAFDFQPANAAPSVGKLTGNKIKFDNVYPNVNLEYTSKSDMLKEDIILNTPEASNTFTFDINTKNLSIEKDAKNGTLSLVDKKGKKVAYFLKPFMIDAKNEMSDKVTLEYQKIGGKEQLVVTADQAWLKDIARQYPVKVDPTIITYTVHKDTFAASWYPDYDFSATEYFSVGNDPLYGTSRSFIQFVLPSLPSSAKVTDVTFSPYQFENVVPSTVDVHQITANWTASGTTWNSQPSFSATPEASVNSNTVGYWDFSITNLAKAWYASSTPNYGIMLKNQNEAEGFKRFISYNYTASTPKLTVNYTVDPIGQEQQWGFTPEGVNGFNGNLSVSAADVTIPGRGIPVSFSRTYNSRSTKQSIFGYGWSANIGASIMDSGYGPIVLTDEDGTEHIFSRQTDGTFVAPTGVYLSLVKDYTNNNYTVTRLDGVKISFNSSGKISKISDTNQTPNELTYNYDISGKLTSITDTIGRATNFYYNLGGNLERITDPAGRSTSFGYDGNGNLVSVTNAESKITSYQYDASHNLVGITDPNGRTTSVGYDTTNDRVTSLSRTITVNGTPTVSTTTLSYNTATNTTTRTDAKGNKTNYIYDAEGKLAELVQDPGGLNYSSKFGYDVENNLIQVIDPKNGNYTASYELGTGNLITESNPLNEQYQYGYDSRNNQTEQVDPENRVNSDTFDQSNNNTDSTDPYTQTSANRYLANGNVEYETTSMSAGENLVTNSSFERDDISGWPAEWQTYKAPGSTANWATSSDAKFGGRSFVIGDTTGWATYMNTRAIAYDSTKSYVLSGYLKTWNLSSMAAYIKADFYDAAGNWIGDLRTPLIGGFTDWTRYQLVLDSSNVPANTAKFYATAGREAATGMALFDGIQVEVGSVRSAYNLVENSSFELDNDSNNLPDQWETNFTLGAGEGRDTTFKHAGGASFKIIGQAGVNKYVKQRIYAKGDQNSKLTLSGWSYADNPDPAGGNYALQVAINYTDGTVDWTNANVFTKENHADLGWEHVAAQVKATKAFSSIDVYYYFYNQRGNAWFDAMRLQEGNNISWYGYDNNSNYLTSVKDPNNNTVTFENDTVGNRTKVIDPKGNATTYGYNLLNQLIQVTDALLGVTGYGYDSNGNRTSVTNANNKTTTYGYNEINQVKSITDPLNKTTTFDYDVVGNQTAINFPNTNRVGFGYDQLNRPVSILFNGLSKYTFGYDNKGNRTAMVDVGKSETTQYSYDADDKLSLVTEPNGNKVSYGYDKTGQVTALTTTIGATNYTTNYQYDPAAQLAKVLFDSSWSKFSFDETGNLAGTVNSNSTKSVLSYDDGGRLKSVKLFTGTSGVIGDYGYTFDVNSNITSVAVNSDTIGSKTINYTYDALNRLTSETLRDGTRIDYTYDAVGNRLTKTVTLGGNVTTTNYSYDAASQLTAVDGVANTYDTNGNLTSDNSRNYEYDANNRLIRVTNKSNGALQASMEYDALGRRTSKTTPSGTTRFYYDGDSTRVLYETDGSGNLLRRFVYGATDQPISMIQGTNTYFYHYNGHGDVVALTNASGAIVAEYDYDAYGVPVVTGREGTVENPYRYAGYRWDPEFGMYYLNARYYAPTLGRFITRDSFHGFEDDPASLNQYNYAKSNPVMFVDPSGHFVVNVITAVIGAGFGALLGEAVADHYGLTGWKRAATIAGFATGGAAVGWFTGPIVTRLATALMPVAYKKMFGLTFSVHAIQRLAERGISSQVVQKVLGSRPFQYFHEGVWKTGYYDAGSQVFLGRVGNVVTTVINNVKPQYIENLKKVKP